MFRGVTFEDDEDEEMEQVSSQGGFHDAELAQQAPPRRQERVQGEEDGFPPLEVGGPSAILCVLLSSKGCGVAYCAAPGDAELWLCEGYSCDTPEDIARLKSVVEPRTILLCAGSVSAEQLESFQAPLDEAGGRTEVLLLKTSCFAPAGARARLLSLPVRGMPDGLSNAEREIFLGTMVDLHGDTLGARALGALVSELAAHGQLSALPLHIRRCSSEGSLCMSVDDFRSLQIFKKEEHPSASGIGSSKEGFSVYSLLNRAKSSVGRKLLRAWMQRPLRDVEQITARLDHVGSLMDVRYQEVVQQAQQELRGIKDAARALNKIVRVESRITDWLDLRSTINSAIQINELLAPLLAETGISAAQALSDQLQDGELAQLLLLLDAVVDIDASRQKKRLEIREGIDADLDKMRGIYAGLGELLTMVASSQVAQLGGNVEHLLVVYMPQLGYEVVLPRTDAPLQQQMQVPGLEYQFHTQERLYFKSALMQELDQDLGDLHSNIVDRTNSIVLELEKHLLAHTEKLLSIVTACAQLDCLMGMAHAARELGLVRPRLTDECVVCITGGRHLLQERCVESFIPNDTSMGSGREGPVKLITGPNASGKSVYLKQVGVIAYLAHLGSYVPAEAATIGILDGIFTRITSRETSALAKSSFLIDLSQLSSMLRFSTARSLLLVDEFGKGTAPLDGAALLGAALEHLMEKRRMSIIVTHFVELLDAGVLADGPIEHLQMEFLVQHDPEQRDRLVFLYKLTQGGAAGSHGFECALAAGMPRLIVERAEEVTRQMQLGIEVQRVETQRDAAKMRRYRNIARQLQEFDAHNGNVEQFLSAILNEEQ